MVNFKNAVIILTSNIGSATILESMSAGDFEGMKQQVTQQVRRLAWRVCGGCMEAAAVGAVLPGGHAL